MVFYAFRCKNCGRWGAKEVRVSILKSTYSCFFCGVSSKIKKSGEFGLAMPHKGPLVDGRVACEVVKQLNERRD